MKPWRRNYLAVWPSLFTVSVGLMAVIPMLPLYIEERFHIEDPDLVAYWTGIIFGAAPLTAAFIGPVWGGLGDRVGRRPMVLRAVLAIAISTALMPLAETPLVLALLRVVQGMFAGYVAPAMALVSADVPAERQGRTLAGLQVALALGLFLGPAVGAEIASWWDRRSVFWVTSGLALLGALPVALFARDNHNRFDDGRGLGFVADLWRRSCEMLQSRVLVGLLVLVFLMRFGQHMVEPFVALFVRELGPWSVIEAGAIDRVHAIDRTVALAFIVLALAQMAITPVWGRLADRLGPLRCLAVVALSLGVIMQVTSFVAGIEQFLLLRCAAACFMAGTMTLAYSALSKRVPSSRRTLAFAMVQSCIQFGLALGPMAGSLIADQAGAAAVPNFRILFNVGGACVLLAGLGMVLLRRSPGGREEIAVGS